MKKVLEACIDQVLEFDSPDEAVAFVAGAAETSISYRPVLRIAGRISLVTQCLKRFAVGSLLERIRL